MDCLDDRLHVFTYPKPLQDLGRFVVWSRSHNTQQILVRLAFDLEIGQFALLCPEVSLRWESGVFAWRLSFDANRTSWPFRSTLPSN